MSNIVRHYKSRGLIGLMPIASLAVAIGFSGPAAAATGTFTTFGLKGYGTEVTALSANLTVTGNLVDRKSHFHGFVRTADGNITLFDALSPQNQTFPKAINASGQIVGYFLKKSSSNALGFVRDPAGTIAKYDFSDGAGSTYFTGINDGGDVTGYFVDGEGGSHGFVLSAGGHLVTFDDDGIGVSPMAINTSGTVTGLTDSQIGFLRLKNGTLSTFSVPGSHAQTAPVAISQSNWITGYYMDFDESVHGFLRDADGNISTVPKKADISTVAGINNHDASVGDYIRGRMDGSFLRKKGGGTEYFSPPGSSSSNTCCINDDGMIAGSFQNTKRREFGFIYTR